MRYKIQHLQLRNGGNSSEYEFELPANSKPMSVHIASAYTTPWLAYLGNLDATKTNKWRLWVFRPGDEIDIPAAAEFLGYIQSSSLVAIFVLKCS